MAVNDNEITLKSKQNSNCNIYKRQFFKQTHFFSDEDDQAYISEIDNYSSDCSSCSDNSDCSDLDVENEFAYDSDDSDTYTCQFKCDYECKKCDPHECSIKCVKYVKYEEIKTDSHGADGSGNKDGDRGGVGGADSKDSGGGNEDSDDNGSDRDSDNSIPSLDNYGGDDKGSDGESDNNGAEDESDVHEEYDDNGAKDGDTDNFGKTDSEITPPMEVATEIKIEEVNPREFYEACELCGDEIKYKTGKLKRQMDYHLHHVHFKYKHEQEHENPAKLIF